MGNWGYITPKSGVVRAHVVVSNCFQAAPFPRKLSTRCDLTLGPGSLVVVENPTRRSPPYLLPPNPHMTDTVIRLHDCPSSFSDRWVRPSYHPNPNHVVGRVLRIVPAVASRFRRTRNDDRCCGTAQQIIDARNFDAPPKTQLPRVYTPKTETSALKN